MDKATREKKELLIRHLIDERNKIEDECGGNVTLDRKIREKTKYRLCKAMGVINDSYDFISDLGDRNLKIEPNHWNLFPACWSSNITTKFYYRNGP